MDGGAGYTVTRSRPPPGPAQSTCSPGYWPLPSSVLPTAFPGWAPGPLSVSCKPVPLIGSPRATITSTPTSIPLKSGTR